MHFNVRIEKKSDVFSSYRNEFDVLLMFDWYFVINLQ